MSNASDSLTSAAAGRGLKTGLEKVRTGSVPGRPVSIFLGPDALSTARANDGARAAAKASWSMGCVGAGAGRSRSTVSAFPRVVCSSRWWVMFSLSAVARA